MSLIGVVVRTWHHLAVMGSGGAGLINGAAIGVHDRLSRIMYLKIEVAVD